jgi:hypothetical protein
MAEPTITIATDALPARVIKPHTHRSTTGTRGTARFQPRHAVPLAGEPRLPRAVRRLVSRPRTEGDGGLRGGGAAAPMCFPPDRTLPWAKCRHLAPVGIAERARADGSLEPVSPGLPASREHFRRGSAHGSATSCVSAGSICVPLCVSTLTPRSACPSPRSVALQPSASCLRRALTARLPPNRVDHAREALDGDAVATKAAVVREAHGAASARAVGALARRLAARRECRRPGRRFREA